MPRRPIVFGHLLIGLLTLTGLSGCNWAGPLSITEGRIRYNDVIEHTTQKQLLLNLIRVSKNQAPVFIDVTEVDASMAISSALSASISGLGIGEKSGSFRVGSLTSGTVTPAVGYAETPTIRYIPLQGQALVQQLAAAISVESLPPLFDSDVPLPTIIDFIVDRLTPGYYDYSAALNILGQLDWETAVTMATAAPRAEGTANPSTEVAAKGAVVVQTVPPVEPARSALVMYLQPYGLTCADTVYVARLWTQLLGLYTAVRSHADNANRDALAALLGRIQGCDGDRLLVRQPGPQVTNQALLAALAKVPSIELRTLPLKSTGDPGSPNHIDSPAPFLRMRSAFGILRSIEVSDYNPAGLIEIVSPEQQAMIANTPWNQGQQFHLFVFQRYCQPGHEVSLPKCRQMREIYDMLPASAAQEIEYRVCQRGAFIMGLAAMHPINSKIQQSLQAWSEPCKQFGIKPPKNDAATEAPAPLLTMEEDDRPLNTTLTSAQLAEERLLRLQRRYILVVSSDTLPADTFAWIDVDGRYYYIASDDVISQRNFRLLMLLSIIQAVTPTPPLVPTVGVGGH